MPEIALSECDDLYRWLTPKARKHFLSIYENLLLTSSSADVGSLLVCASNPAEGATSVAMGIALAVSTQRSIPVLLIDGNYHDPQVCGLLKTYDPVGIGDILAGRIDPDAVAIPTVVPCLAVMGTGVLPAGRISLLEPPNLKNVLQKLKEIYPLVIIDGPAVNVYSESVLYASQVDRVLLVVHSGVTRTPVVAAALARLSGSSRIEIILNRRLYPIPPFMYRRL
ncbi:MAG: CpsD/CapB family tyrosine-protein kinase [Syntrophobacteraceae bacterium]